jgi:hypothetical protein
MRVLLLLSLVACNVASAEDKASGPVVLELFTSQGCSSCPPADRLLKKLADGGEVGGKQIVALSFHVDYWNDLGWRDPYSAAAWTERQHQYARALGDSRVYTPQLVVGGTAGMVGSNVNAVTTNIKKTARPALLPAKASWTRDAVEITTTAPAGADVLVAVFENARTNKVPRGENSGRSLVHRNVVRKLERVGKSGAVKISIDPTWKDVGAVVFAQRPDKTIDASALVPRT